MKRLFKEEMETYTDEACEISKILGLQIRKWLDMYCNDMGYSVNDLQNILLDEVYFNCAEFRFLRNTKFRDISNETE